MAITIYRKGDGKWNYAIMKLVTLPTCYYFQIDHKDACNNHYGNYQNIENILAKNSVTLVKERRINRNKV